MTDTLCPHATTWDTQLLALTLSLLPLDNGDLSIEGFGDVHMGAGGIRGSLELS